MDHLASSCYVLDLWSEEMKEADEEWWQNIEDLVRSHLRAYKANRQDEGYTVHALMLGMKGMYAMGKQAEDES